MRRSPRTRERRTVAAPGLPDGRGRRRRSARPRTDPRGRRGDRLRHVGRVWTSRAAINRAGYLPSDRLRHQAELAIKILGERRSATVSRARSTTDNDVCSAIDSMKEEYMKLGAQFLPRTSTSTWRPSARPRRAAIVRLGDRLTAALAGQRSSTSRAAAATKRIVFGTAVTNPFTRHLTVTASAFGTLAQLHPDRIVLGSDGRQRRASDGLPPVRTKSSASRSPCCASCSAATRSSSTTRSAPPLGHAGPPRPDHDLGDRPAQPASGRSARRPRDAVRGGHPRGRAPGLSSRSGGAADAGRGPTRSKISILWRCASPRIRRRPGRPAAGRLRRAPTTSPTWPATTPTTTCPRC